MTEYTSVTLYMLFYPTVSQSERVWKNLFTENLRYASLSDSPAPFRSYHSVKPTSDCNIL